MALRLSGPTEDVVGRTRRSRRHPAQRTAIKCWKKSHRRCFSHSGWLRKREHFRAFGINRPNHPPDTANSSGQPRANALFSMVISFVNLIVKGKTILEAAATTAGDIRIRIPGLPMYRSAIKDFLHFIHTAASEVKTAKRQRATVITHILLQTTSVIG